MSESLSAAERRGDPGAAPSGCELAQFVAEVSPLTGGLFLAALLRHLGRSLGVSHAFVAETIAGPGGSARTIAASMSGSIVHNFTYPIARMPCCEVVAAGESCYPWGVRDRYSPALPAGWGDLDSYCGVRLHDGDDRASAWLAVMDPVALADAEAARAQLALHAPRAAAELQRLRAEAAARRGRERLEARADELRARLSEAERRAAGPRLSEERFARAFRASPGLLTLSTRAEGRFLEVNDSFLRATGYSREEVVGRTGGELGLWVEPLERDRLARLLQVEGSLRDREVGFVTKHGEVRTALVSAEAVELGAAPCILSSAIDITARKQAEAALRESEERYALAARGANDGLWDWNLQTNEVYFSPRWKQMLGYLEDGIGTRPAEWSSRIHPDDKDAVAMAIVAHLEGLTDHFESEHRVLHRDGGYRWMLCRGLAVRDGFDRACRFAGSQTDVTQRKRAEQQVIHDAFYDALTGLPNRALYMDRLGRAVERAKRREGYSFAVLYLDLDGFKLVNESLGHAAGDRLLAGVARRIEACLRPQDSVARLGGDEFAVLLEDVVDASDATRVAERVGHALRLPLDAAGQEVFSTASIGIAVSNTGYDRPEEPLRDADTAMYRAKAEGRARYAVFDPAMHARAVARLQLETDLRRGLERDEFGVAYQPIVSVATGALAGFEALARWRHPTRGGVSPAEFVAVAEETGLIMPLGDRILREACAQGRRWLEHPGGALPISVNLSRRQLMQPDAVEGVAAILDETGMPARLLTLEITETVLMQNAAEAAARLARLKQLGVGVSVDDFGTGHSCLSLLHEFPIDKLKADRSFVSRIGAEGQGDETLRTILTLARNLRMDVVAEGVETAQQLAGLRRLGCAYAQGHLFSEAVDAERASRLIAAPLGWR